MAIDLKPVITQNGANAAAPGPDLDELFADDVKPSAPKVLGDHTTAAVMQTYYRSFFPFKQIYLWLNQDQIPSKNFTNREIALTLQNDAYLRYLSFANADELKKEIVRQNPSRFEIGPVYSAKPKDKKMLTKSNFKPLLRELVFDIDMTDYDAIRTCCQDKAMCKRCWRFISMAVEVLDKTLREDFGFNHLLWVYSGRRGIHCWVSDLSAMSLTDEQRKAIVAYIEVIKGGAKMEKKVNLSRPLHPSLEVAYNALKTHFAKVILQDQDCFSKPEQWETLLRLLPDKDAANRLSKEFNDKPKATSAERWKAVLGASKLSGTKYSDGIQDIILQYTYPRIDTEVSKKLNHLLKSPFCIHPGTGRVCVPLHPSQVASFDPDSCLTVAQLLEESEKSGGGWEQTSLKPFVDTFEKFLEGVVKDNRRGKKEDEEVSMEF